MKLLVVFVLILGSGLAHGVCESGQTTALISNAEFVRKEPNGNTLKITLESGSPILVNDVSEARVELYATTEFHGQQISLLSEIDAVTAAKVLRCSTSAN